MALINYTIFVNQTTGYGNATLNLTEIANYTWTHPLAEQEVISTMIPLALAILAFGFFYLAMNINEEQFGLRIFFFIAGLLMAINVTQITAGAEAKALPAVTLTTYALIVGLGLVVLYILWDALKALAGTASPWERRK